MTLGVLGYSGHILTLARKSCERAATTDAYEALSAILLSMIGFECFLNEWEERLQGNLFGSECRQLSDLAFALDALERQRAGVRSKIEAIHYFLAGSKIDWGQSPYQDIAFLVRVRNALVHRKPERIEYEWSNADREYEPHAFVKYLVARGVVNAPHPKAPAQWSAYVVCPPAARWTYNTVIEVISKLVAMLPAGLFAHSTAAMIRHIQRL